MSHVPPTGETRDVVVLSQAVLGALRPGVAVPGYDRTSLTGSIVHVGVGGFVRAHLATYMDELAESGTRDWGIVGAGLLPQDEAMAAALAPQDHLYTLVQRGASHADVRVIGSLVGYVHAAGAPRRLEELLAASTTRLVSLTITEAGYPVDAEGLFDPSSAQAGPGSVFAVIVRALRLRHDTGRSPLSILSCDNIAGNGDVTRAAVIGVAQRFDPTLVPWIERAVAFPNSMVDRITPATTEADRAWLARTHGIHDRWPVMSEPFRQWVVEDRFADGRPPLERLDVVLASDVRPYEQVKLRLLNAAHSCLAYPAALLGIDRVDRAMQEPLLERLVRRYLDDEAAPVVPRVGGIDLDGYRSTLVERFRNPAVADQVHRLCQDGSAKLRTFLLPVVRDQLVAGGPVEVSALAAACWCVYLRGQSDGGTSIEVAPDPLLEEATAHARAAEHEPTAFLRFRRVFGELDQEERFVDAFTLAHDRLISAGVRPAIEAALDRGVAT